MSALSSLGEKPFIIAAVAICFFVAAVLILLIFRLAFGRRLRMAGGRGRQLRLGIVDAFDLDRQRQLVIVRRDNTEHLIMIGGPNDILIESQIVRAEARDSRETRGHGKEPRDKDAKEIRDKDIKEPVAPPKPAEPKLPPATPMPPVTPLPPLSPVIPEPLQPAAQEIAAAVRPASRAPVPPTAAPRRTPSRPDIKPAEPPVRVEPELPAAASNPPPKPAPTNAPGFLRWPARSAPSFKPSTDVIPPPPASESSPHEPTPVPDPMESLEEEMAKLLGRGPNKP